MKNEEMMEKASMGKLFMSMCIPTIMVMLVIVIYNMADIFFIGKTGDTNQVAAISLSGPIFSVFQGIGTLLGGGGSIAISIALGKRERQRVRQISSFCFYGSLFVGVLLLLVVNIWIHPIVSLLGASASIMSYTITYIRILSFGAPAILFSNVYANVIRSDGSVKQSMIANMLGTIINVILDPIFILALDMGVAGAAIATVIGNIGSCVYILWYVKKKQKNYSLAIKDFKISDKILTNVVSLGLPLALSTVLMSFASMFSNKLLIGYGDIVIAANGVASKSGMLLAMIAMGICMGVQPAISYNYGAGNLRRMKQIIKATGVLTVVVGTVLSGVFLIFRDQIIGVFMHDPELLEYGKQIMLASLVTGPIYGIYQLCTTYLQATGKVSYATIVSVLRQGLIYIPILVLTNYLWEFTGLIFAAAISDVLSIIIGLYLSLKWNKKVYNGKKMYIKEAMI